MVLGLGTDIVTIDRVMKAIKGERFLVRCYTKGELEYLMQKNAESYAGIFAAKEAVSKALGTGFSQIAITDIEICHNEKKKPFVVLHNKALEEANRLGITNWHISISHCEAYAVATAIAE